MGQQETFWPEPRCKAVPPATPIALGFVPIGEGIINATANLGKDRAEIFLMLPDGSAAEWHYLILVR